MTSSFFARPARLQRGTTLIEVLVTVVILAFGLLGIAAFQSKAQIGSIEAYQRAQAVVLLNDMVSRVTNNYNSTQSAHYVTSNPLGTGDTSATDCASKTVGYRRDHCEWSQALLGASERADGDTKNVGAMSGARGCVAQIQALNDTKGACTPGIYLVTVAWQGLHATRAPALACGKDLYGPDTQRRAISARVTVGVPRCDPNPL